MGGQPVTGEPTTAASAEMLADPRFHGSMCDMAAYCSCGMTQNLLNAEREARAAALADAVAAVEKLLDQYDLVDVREAVAAIKELEEPHQETGEPR